MDEIRPSPVRFETTARLLAAIAALPVGARWALLERLLGDRLNGYLMRSVVEMPPDRRQGLLEWLLETPREEDGMATLTLDEEDTLMRRNHRRSCRLKAVAVAGARSFDAEVTDISAVGMFLATDAGKAPGTKIRVSTRLPGAPKPLVLSGVVTRGSPSGMAVKFEGLSPAQAEAIERFVAGAT